MHEDDRIQREQILRSAVLAGQEQAWRRWYEESFADLHAYVLWRCAGLRDAAEEVVQDTWLTAVRRMGSFDPLQGSFAGWLRGIAAHLLRNHFRRQVRRDRRTLALAAAPVELPAPESDGRSEDQAERIARALSSLPERYEQVLRAKYLEGLSVQAIAGSRDESVKAIESLLTRARQAFRDAYLALEDNP
jgi:RNA polymerase sigma-70 factor (ECF subfamily)